MADTPAQDRKLGLPRTRVGGRFVTAYHAELAQRIIERIANGETLRSICDDEGMPSEYTFRRWVQTQPGLSEVYAVAREMSAHSMEEEALELAREVAQNPDTTVKIRAVDVAMGQLRWSASRRNPRVFSERGAVQITVPIQINTSLDLGDGGGGTVEHPDIYDLSATVAEVPREDVPEAPSEPPKLEVPAQPPKKPRGGWDQEAARRGYRAKVRARMDRLAEEADKEKANAVRGNGVDGPK